MPNWRQKSNRGNTDEEAELAVRMRSFQMVTLVLSLSLSKHHSLKNSYDNICFGYHFPKLLQQKMTSTNTQWLVL